MRTTRISLGLDDIDSPRGGCTTHFASCMIRELIDLGAEWEDYPGLVRLNPNIPFRTRGNGAVVLRFNLPQEHTDEILPLVQKRVDSYVEASYPNTNPGVVIAKGTVPEQVVWFAETALWRTLPISLARRIIGSYSLDYMDLGNGRGLIGAIAAIGNQLADDHTYEFIAYRSPDDHSRSRKINRESVVEMDKKMESKTFSNIDPSSGNILIAPQGPDPVLYGIRGEKAADVKRASLFIETENDVKSWTIFRTNQGTGQHLSHTVRISEIRPYMSARIVGTVISRPKMVEGGHTLFKIGDGAHTIDCAAYEPTGEFRNVIMLLRPSDRVMLHAGVRPASRSHGLTLNLEGIEITHVSEEVQKQSPQCPECMKRMTSAGKEKGYKCTHCGHKEPSLIAEIIPVKRELRPGLYLPPLRAQRHLTRPESRKNASQVWNPASMISEWYWP